MPFGHHDAWMQTVLYSCIMPTLRSWYTYAVPVSYSSALHWCIMTVNHHEALRHHAVLKGLTGPDDTWVTSTPSPPFSTSTCIMQSWCDNLMIYIIATFSAILIRKWVSRQGNKLIFLLPWEVYNRQTSSWSQSQSSVVWIPVVFFCPTNMHYDTQRCVAPTPILNHFSGQVWMSRSQQSQT